jgi:acyl transferase domain-containing protein/SAM-dependent methyltransferase/acyl carrier protein
MESIAIIGVGCRFPGADSPERFWELIRNRIDAIREVPQSRWSSQDFYDRNPQAPGKLNTLWCGLLDNVDEFDYEFFGIPRREAIHMDPQQRLLLTVAWEALEHAAQSPGRLRGSDTGIFVGISTDDYSRLYPDDLTAIDAYTGTGNALSVAANRISYRLDLRGPSWVVDTACSSSLVAIHQACQSLRLRECSLAIAGGVNLILTPQLTIAFSQAGMMSPRGRCRAFDDDADGYVRGEGCGLIVLKRLSDALACRDNILAVIRGSAVNQDGRTNGLTSPNGLSQKAVISKALENAGVSPAQISYVEAHGTGTPLGDPIEMNSLMEVLARGRSPEDHCWVGSVKTNIGHLEAAAGIAGLVKVVMALVHKQIPPQLHFETLNRYIPLADTPFVIPIESEPWLGEAGRRLAGVSSFGFAGTNAHIILQEAPFRETAPAAVERPYHVFTVSAKSEAALRELCARCAQHVLRTGVSSKVTLPDLCYSANVGRYHFPHRAAVVAGTVEDLSSTLAELAAANDTLWRRPGTHPPKIAFLFTGEGSEYAGMGRELFESQHSFRQVIERCEDAFASVSTESLLSVLYDTAGREEIHQPAYAQVALFAVEMALAELWREWGIEPAWVMGHGIGEYAAACTAGVFSLEDGVRLAAARGPLTQPEFAGAAREAKYSNPELPLVSTSGRSLGGREVASARYWLDQAPQPERFEQGIEWLAAQGAGVFLEIGPKPVLRSLIRDCRAAEAARWCASLRPGSSDWRQMLETLVALYEEGVGVDWEGFDRPYLRRRVVLPTYPLRGERCWLASPKRFRAPAAQSNGSGSHPFLGRRIDIAAQPHAFFFQSELSDDSPAFLKDHRVNGRTVLSASAYLEMAVASSFLCDPTNGPLAVENVRFLEPLALSPEPQSVQFSLTKNRDGTFSFSVHALAFSPGNRQNHWTAHATGMLRAETGVPPVSHSNLDCLRRDVSGEIGAARFYDLFGTAGNDYGPSFRSIDQVWKRGHQSFGRIRLPDSCLFGADDYMFHPVLLDACFQLAGLAASELDALAPDPWIPAGIERLLIHGKPGRQLWCVANISYADSHSALADISILDPSDTPLAHIFGLRLSKASGAKLFRREETSPEWFYRVDWRPAGAVAQPVSAAAQSDAPSEIADGLEISLSSITAGCNLDSYYAALSSLDALSVQYILAAFRKLGWELQTGDSFSIEAKATELGIVQPQRRLFSRLVEILAEHGIATSSGTEFKIADSSLLSAPDEYERSPLHPVLVSAEARLLERCAPKLAEVLRGKCNSLELLFPAGDLSLVSRLYEDSPGARAMNRLVADAVSIACERLGSRERVRILEIGAGTGGTTSAILPVLRQDRVEYTFTDVSPWFSNKAREKFRGVSCLTYGVLDIERNPETQGFEPGVFDLIIATNVFHATADLRQTLKHTRALLAPGGLLLLLEGTKRLAWVDLIFGLTEGWWRFCDLDLRPSHPLLELPAWKSLLAEEGFAGVASVSPFREDGPALSALLIAHSTGAGESPLSRNRKEAVANTSWLIFTDRGGVGESLANRFAALGNCCHLVFQGPEFSHAGIGRYELNPLRDLDFQRLLTSLAGGSQPAAFQGIVFLWPLDLGSASCQAALHLLKALTKLPRAPRLYLVTRGAVPARETITDDGLAQSPLWGMANVIALEHPEFRCVRLDLDPRESDSAGELLAEVMAQAAEDQVAIRNGLRYVARLVRHDFPHVDRANLPVRPDASYLITGGLKGLGLLVARWLVDRGAREIALLSRSLPNEKSSRTIAELIRAGAKIKTIRADVADEPAMARAIVDVRATMSPLRGIVHTAGILDDGSLMNLTPGRFENVLAPKTAGAWNLHLLSAGIPLDFFALFSSTASILGSSAQANHAAANAYLDALAHYRRSRSLPAISINWGAWSEVGSAAAKDVEARLEAFGIGTIAPPLGLDALARLLSSPLPQAAVIPVNWPKFSKFRGASPFIADLAVAAFQEPVRKTPFLQQLAKVEPRSQHAFLLDHVRSQVAAVRGVDAAEIDLKQGLFELGLDSLMAIDLRRTLEESLACSLPSTIAFDYPTVDALVDFVARDILHLDTPAPNSAAAVPDRKSELAASLDGLSADEIAARLNRKMLSLKQGQA